MTTELTPLQDAFLASRKLARDYELGDLSAQDIDKMPMATYAAIRQRAGLPAADPYTTAYTEFEPPGRPRQDPGQAVAPDQGVDFASMGLAAYKDVREQYIKRPAGDGVGLFS